jgi:hypothetical protein
LLPGRVFSNAENFVVVPVFHVLYWS